MVPNSKLFDFNKNFSRDSPDMLESRISVSIICDFILFFFRKFDPFFINSFEVIKLAPVILNFDLLILNSHSFPHEFHHLKIHRVCEVSNLFCGQ